MKGQIWMIPIFIILIGVIALLFMAFTVPLGYTYKVSQSLTPDINDTDIETSVTTTQDSIWNLWWMVPTAMIVIVIIWAFMYTQRKESGSYYVNQ